MNELRIEHIDYRLILVDNYKSLGLSEYDLCVLLSIDNILKNLVDSDAPKPVYTL